MRKKVNFLDQYEVAGYIITSYAGVEAISSNSGIMRRVFEWHDGDTLMRGNTEAFVVHVGKKFGYALTKNQAPQIHAFLRDLGEIINPHAKHSTRSADGPSAGRFRQPDPDEWVIMRGLEEK